MRSTDRRSSSISCQGSHLNGELSGAERVRSGIITNHLPLCRRPISLLTFHLAPGKTAIRLKLSPVARVAKSKKYPLLLEFVPDRFQAAFFTHRLLIHGTCLQGERSASPSSSHSYRHLDADAIGWPPDCDSGVPQMGDQCFDALDQNTSRA